MLDVEEQSGVTVVRLAHGKVNALDLELLRAITDAMRELDPGTPVVLTGSGSVFCAGVDLRRIVDGGPDYVREYLPALSEAFLAVFDHPGPVVAAVNGHALAGGCVIAAACDVRLMSQGTIGLTELGVGVPFPTAAIEIMRHVVGPAAERLVLTAAPLDVAGAVAIGLVQQVPDAFGAAVTLAAAMGEVPADVYAFSKRQLRQPVWERIAAHDSADAEVLEVWSSDRSRDAITAYLESLRRR
ncbi:enoyl-CoA hydratase/isomerase family protein [Labedaea rhizosphaerae]|uniref:Enoyl-CoA hydratase n=1 Tax=Labedaea rhizosphaerae TaxID=598644 RepID=A0A4R6RYA2_LABRH|nr:enoyl-CoA hydratase/isomerase family protein [Labedaea rhizosphaerae]TDP92091.1 enoyl-CoA hydratase [Labedaea rhizosphaerae]